MNRPIQSEEDLRYWLAHEDWYMSSHTRQWLERTPPEQAADVLDRIAADAQPQPPSSARSVLMGVVNAFSVSGELGRQDIQKRNAGVRAAVMLANLGDARGIPPLVRVFETNPRRQNKYQELIEAALLRFLSGAAGPTDIAPYAPDLRDLAGRIWESGGERRDLSDVLTELLLAVLRRLHALGGDPNRAVIRSIAESAATAPHRKRAREAAASLLNS